MCPESRLPRGSKIRALLDWFPEIHLRLSMNYVYSSVLVSMWHDHGLAGLLCLA